MGGNSGGFTQHEIAEAEAAMTQTPTTQDAGLIERLRTADHLHLATKLLCDEAADRLEALSQAANAPQGEAVAWRDAVGAVFDAGMCFGGRKDRGANEYLEVRKNAVDIVMLAALADRLEAREGWRDIESAPKDGSVVLLGYPPHPRIDRSVYEGRWNRAQNTWTSCNGFILHSDATHWMPLPPAPQPDE